MLHQINNKERTMVVKNEIETLCKFIRHVSESERKGELPNNVDPFSLIEDTVTILESRLELYLEIVLPRTHRNSIDALDQLYHNQGSTRSISPIR